MQPLSKRFAITFVCRRKNTEDQKRLDEFKAFLNETWPDHAKFINMSLQVNRADSLFNEGTKYVASTEHCFYPYPKIGTDNLKKFLIICMDLRKTLEAPHSIEIPEDLLASGEHFIAQRDKAVRSPEPALPEFKGFCKDCKGWDLGICDKVDEAAERRGDIPKDGFALYVDVSDSTGLDYALKTGPMFGCTKFEQK